MKTNQLIAAVILAGTVFTSRSLLAATCDDSWSQAQLLLKQTHLIDARAQYRACLDSCASGTGAEVEASRDCSETLKRLEQDIPTVVLSATDAAGKQLADVTVTVDGRQVASRLDGVALELDPGSHAFAFTFQGTTKTLQASLNQGQRNQEVKMVFDNAGQPAPAPAAASSGNLQHVSFSTEDSSSWELASAEGKVVCALPCAADIDADKGYQIRVKGGGSRKTFLGSSVTGTSAMVTPPRGNKGMATITFLASTAVAGIGVGVYFAGNNQECSYGPYTDKDGNQQYSQKVKGSCASTPAPAGYTEESGVDTGDTSKGNQKGGLALAIGGGAGMVVGGIWWLLSDSEPAITWNSPTGSMPAKKIGLLVGPTSLGLRGTW